MSWFPGSVINTDNPDIVLAILAGESPKKCCTRGCNHWGRFVFGHEGMGMLDQFWCECCAQTWKEGYGKRVADTTQTTGTFMCDGTRRRHED